MMIMKHCLPKLPQLFMSNLSKIKPKLRTQGRVTGNWGRNKVKAGSTLSDIGMSDKEFINIVTQDEYLKRMYQAFDTTNDSKLKNFCFTQIRNILIQRNQWH